MDFVAAVLILFVFYVRPQEISEVFAGMRPLLLALWFAMFACLIRPQRIPFKSLLRTPHDWVFLFYFSWFVYNSFDRWGTFKEFLSSLLIYFFIVQCVTTMRRVLLFLYIWAGFIFFIAFMAVASEYGFDPTGSHYLTHNFAGGRLIFNTTMFHNPNALGHNIAPLIPLFYFLLWWRRPVFMKEVALALIALPVYCVYLTQSKGAFIASFVAIVAAMVFGRPKMVQVGMLVLAGTLGVGALQYLPRFGGFTPGTARADEALAGRVRALEFGLKTFRNNPSGVGYKQWLTAMKREHGEELSLASHNTYSNVAAEHGWFGLMLFLGLLYAGLRTTISARTESDDEERIRRCLFVLVVTFAVSCWVIDRLYLPNLFMILGAVAAYHRCLMDKNPVATERDPADDFRAVRPGMQPAAAGAGAGGSRLLGPELAVSQAAAASMGGQLLQPGRRFAVAGQAPEAPAKPLLFMPWAWASALVIGIDIFIIWVGRHGVERFWEYVIKNA